MNTSNVFIKTQFLRAYQIAGVDYVVTNITDPDIIFDVVANSQLTVPFAIGICHSNQPPPIQYTKFYYDPSITAVFTGVEPADVPNLPPTARARSRLNPAAYAVPVAVVVVALAAVVIVLTTVPSMRARFLPSLGSQKSNRGGPHVKTTTEPAKPKDRDSSWRKSHRPDIAQNLDRGS